MLHHSRHPHQDLHKIIAILIVLLVGLGAVIYVASTKPIPQAQQDVVLESPDADGSDVLVNITAVQPDEQQEMQERIINPYRMYYKGSSGNGSLLSLFVTENTEDTRLQFPYIVEASFDTGVQEGFTVERASGEIQWWSPTCQLCSFSQEFKDAYPEIVLKYEPSATLEP